MNRLTQLSTAVTMLGFCAAAHASDWRALGNGPKKGSQLLIDMESVHVNGILRRAWIKVTFPPHSEKGTGKNAKKWGAFSVLNYQFDCSDGQSTVEAASIYYSDGTQESVPSYQVSSGWEPVVPDTALEAAMKTVCAITEK